MGDLRAIEPLLSLTRGRWRSEATSLLGATLPFQIATACQQATPDPATCDPLIDQEVLPWAVATCAQSEGQTGQCFDHVCGGLAQLAVARGTEGLADTLQDLHTRGLAADARVATMPGCAPLWAGRLLVQQTHGADLGSVVAACASLPVDQALRCRSGAAEAALVQQLRVRPAADEQDLIKRVANPTEVPPDLAAHMPCAAFSVLQHNLVSGLLASRVSASELLALRDAGPDCAWADEAPRGLIPPK
jgi:hypothetical protein